MPDFAREQRRRHHVISVRWIMTSLCKTIVCFIVALLDVAQSQTFEKIAIRKASSADPRSMRMQILPNGNFIATTVPVIVLLSYAYDVPVDPSLRLSPLPEWTVRERYDIEGKATSNVLTPNSKNSDSRSRIHQEFRRLLADRFKLALRVENKTMPVYALRVSRDGPKLQRSNITDQSCIFDTDPEGCHSFAPGFGHPLNAKAIDMDDLTFYIANWTDLPVVNRTSLKGLFAVSTEGWEPMRLPPPPPSAIPDTNHFAGLPTIFTVLGKLGLELNRQEETLPVYLVEHIEQPTVN
jgi:uncharacterized protein (TIGR03435 family)